MIPKKAIADLLGLVQVPGWVACCTMFRCSVKANGPAVMIEEIYDGYFFRVDMHHVSDSDRSLHCEVKVSSATLRRLSMTGDKSRFVDTVLGLYRDAFDKLWKCIFGRPPGWRWHKHYKGKR